MRGSHHCFFKKIMNKENYYIIEGRRKFDFGSSWFLLVLVYCNFDPRVAVMKKKCTKPQLKKKGKTVVLLRKLPT